MNQQTRADVEAGHRLKGASHTPDARRVAVSFVLITQPVIFGPCHLPIRINRPG